QPLHVGFGVQEVVAGGVVRGVAGGGHRRREDTVLTGVASNRQILISLRASHTGTGREFRNGAVPAPDGWLTPGHSNRQSLFAKSIRVQRQSVGLLSKEPHRKRGASRAGRLGGRRPR